MATTSLLEPHSDTVLGHSVPMTADHYNRQTMPGRKSLSRTGKGVITPTILVVDDEPDVLNALRRRLEYMGFRVICAEDGEMATQVAFHESPDVIILDVGLPMLDGHGVAERLRHSRQTRYTPVIYLTARTAQEDRASADENCAFAYITKPFIAAEILSTVNRALELSQAMFDKYELWESGN